MAPNIFQDVLQPIQSVAGISIYCLPNYAIDYRFLTNFSLFSQPCQGLVLNMQLAPMS
jgi:hypothetical protein